MILCLSARAGTVKPLSVISVILMAFQALNDITVKSVEGIADARYW